MPVLFTAYFSVLPVGLCFATIMDTSVPFSMVMLSIEPLPTTGAVELRPADS